MRAGLMRDVLVFQKPATATTPSGFVSKAYKEVFRCRAHRKSYSRLQGTDGAAREEFTGQRAVFQVRRYPQIGYGLRVLWAGAAWEIRLIEPARDELTLTLEKIDT